MLGGPRQVRVEAAPHLGLVAQLVESSTGDDDPAPHDGDPVSHELGLAEDMCRHDQGRAAVLLLAEVVTHIGRRNWIETGGGLGAQNPIWLADGGPGQASILAPTPGAPGPTPVAAAVA